ncbi:MAG: MFS transporter [Phenylobacterium sp.]
MVTKPRPFEGLTRNTGLLALSSLFGDISTEMLYPVLPVFLTQVLGAGGSAVGLIEGFAQATQNIVQGFSGSLSDRLRRRKPVALVGYALSALSKPLIGVSTTWSGVLGARFLDRFGSGSRSAPRDALVAASAAEEHRGKAFGLEGAGDNAGAFIGPLIAVALITVWAVDLRWIFYLAVVPGLLAFLMVLLVEEAPAAAKSETRIDALPTRLPKGYRRYLAATAIFGLGNSSNAFLILETRALGASLPATILIYAGFNLAAALISYPAGHLSDRLGRRNLLLAAELVFLVSYLGFGLSGDLVLIGVMFGLYGVFQGVFRAVGKALAADFAPPARRASAIGWYSATVGLSGLIASLVAGALWDQVSHGMVFLVGAAFAALGALALLLLVPAPKARAA